MANKVAWWPTRKLRFDASMMNAESIEIFINKLYDLKPPLIQGYTGAVASVAEHILRTGARVHRPRAVWVTSSVLTGLQRTQIEEAFGAPVYDQYGSCETRFIAAQCEEGGGMHMHSDAVHVDFVGSNGGEQDQGVTGRILVTDLWSGVFPLIRYENGDEGVRTLGTCPCGRKLPLMGPVAGRVSDRVVLPGGGSLSGEYLTTIFDEYPELIRQFQVHQRADYSVVVYYVSDSGSRDLKDVLAAVKEALGVRIGEGVSLTMESVSQIKHDRGKLRFVISDVVQP